MIEQIGARPRTVGRLAPHTLSAIAWAAGATLVRAMLPSRAGPAGGYGAAICIPARDEAARIGSCIDALAAQRAIRRDQVLLVLLVNNSRDSSYEVAARRAAALSTPCLVLEASLPARHANAGQARRLAMDVGLRLIRPHGAILTTDADSRPAPDWLRINLDLLASGYDAVCGLVRPDPHEALELPEVIHARWALEWRYMQTALALEARLDPDPDNPWPRHGLTAGASLAVSAGAYRAVGGLPRLKVGEDRALVQALLRDARKVRHSNDALVLTSCRLRGRAAGGVADGLAGWLADPDCWCDPQIEPADAVWLRAAARGGLRRAATPRARRDAVASLALAPFVRARIERGRSFGAAWDLIERTSPRLVRRQIRPSALPDELARLEQMLSTRTDQSASASAPSEQVDTVVLAPQGSAAGRRFGERCNEQLGRRVAR